MNYRPDEKDWMAYLYGELEGAEKEKFEQYISENEDARLTLEKYKGLRTVLSAVEDKEVIAPPIVMAGPGHRFSWNTPYFRTFLSVAASLLLVVLIGSLSGAEISVSDSEFRISFGKQAARTSGNIPENAQEPLTALQVQDMINRSLENNNTALESSWKQNQEKLTASVRKNLEANSSKIDELVRQASTASQEQVRSYVAGLQSQNMELVKEYFALTSTEQKNYIENLLVDFADYLQQQRANDLQLVQTRLNSLEQNTDIFKQETEQILTSIISSVGNAGTDETRN